VKPSHSWRIAHQGGGSLLQAMGVEQSPLFSCYNYHEG